MKLVAVILFASLLLAGAAETNQFFIKRPLELSAAALRLNASPYFRSQVDDFKKCVHHSLYSNPVEPELEPTIDFGALVEYPETGEPRHYFWLFSYAERPTKWVDIRTNRLTVIVDGKSIISTEPVPGMGGVDLDERRPAGAIWEGYHFAASAEAIRAVANARRVQFRLDGERRVLQRSLDATNIARFKVFANAFLQK